MSIILILVFSVQISTTRSFFFNFNKEEEHDTIQVLLSTLNSRNSLKFGYVREEHVHRRPEKIGWFLRSFMMRSSSYDRNLQG